MKNFKYIVIGLVIVLLTTIMALTLKEEPVVVKLNGEVLSFDVKPKLVSGGVMVPFKGIFEALGAEVEWDYGTQSVTAYDESNHVKMIIGSKIMYVNGEEISIDMAPAVISNRTFVPVKFAAQAFGYKVDWSDEDNTVYITMEENIY